MATRLKRADDNAPVQLLAADLPETRSATAAVRKLMAVFAYLNRELKVYRLMMRDSRTPTGSKILLGAALGYAIWPLGIVPDFIPIVGYVDDLIIVPVLVFMAVRRVPREVIDDCRHQVSIESAETDIN